MTTNMKLSTLTHRAIGAAVLLAVPAGALASDESADIIVQPSTAMAQFQEETRQDLDEALDRGAVRFNRHQPNNSIVQVTFSLGDDGKADDIRLYNSEGNWAARKIAVRAVKRLDDLDRVPVTNPQNVQFLANIIFADNEDIEEQLVERLAQSERVRMASSTQTRTYIALGN